MIDPAYLDLLDELEPIEQLERLIEIKADHRGLGDTLNRRLADVVTRLLDDGHTQSDIADRLGISRQAVAKFLNRYGAES